MDADATADLRVRALASALRWRILRLCLHEPRTNKELADLLGLNPATTLHHVRMLTDAGFLAAQEPRRGHRNAREVPYLATRATWTGAHGFPEQSAVMVALLGQELSGSEARDVHIGRLGVRLTEDDHAELGRRLADLLEDFKARDTDAAGARPWSLMTFVYPDDQLPLGQAQNPDGDDRDQDASDQAE